MAVGSDVLTWATAISTNADNGRKIIFRYAEQLSPAFDRATQPVRIIIAWKYHSENGQPIVQDHQRMNVLEDALESALEEDRFATLALVSTGEDLREWTYYAKSENEFLARLNYALAGLPAFPIEIHSASDPNWEMYEQFKTGVIENRVNECNRLFSTPIPVADNRRAAGNITFVATATAIILTSERTCENCA
jgi:hypothetical protein